LPPSIVLVPVPVLDVVEELEVVPEVLDAWVEVECVEVLVVPLPPPPVPVPVLSLLHAATAPSASSEERKRTIKLFGPMESSFRARRGERALTPQRLSPPRA
jgi:hypothetical protein